MGRLSLWELVVIAILIAVIFGGRRLPELGRSLGRGLANFRHAVQDTPKSQDTEEQDEPKNPTNESKDA